MEKIIEITSKSTTYRNAIQGLTNRNWRQKNKLVTVEGLDLVNAALKNNGSLLKLLVENISILEKLQRKQVLKLDTKIYLLTNSEVKKNIKKEMLGIFEIPCRNEEIFSQNKCFDEKNASGVMPVTLICDQVRNPNNMAMLLEAFSVTKCNKMLITKGCVDVWNQKVLESSFCAPFHCNLATNLDWKQINECIPLTSCVFLADNCTEDDKRLSNNNNIKLFEIDNKNKDDKVESIKSSNLNKIKNFASTCLSYRKENFNSNLEINTKELFVCEYSSEAFSFQKYENLINDKKYYNSNDIKINPTYTNNENDCIKESINEDSLCLNNYKYNNELVLIIGGETQGLSTEAFDLCRSRKNSGKVYIPMNPKVDSLNCGVAAGILLFELARKFLSK